MTTAEAAARLAAMDQVLILTHVRPDGDTIGSAAALCCGLRALGKTAYLLPNPELTATYAPYAAPYAAPYLAEADFAPAYVVSVDIAALSLLPENARPYQDRIALAIDHHPSQEFFARETCLEADSAACGEIVYDILRQLTPLTPEMALPLYVAISTDTGCFVYSNTTPRSHRIAAQLMDCGIDVAPVNKALFRTKSAVRLAMEARMVAGMERCDAGRVVVMTSIFHLGATATGVTGIFAILLHLNHPIQYIVSMLVAMGVAFILTWLFGYKAEKPAAEKAVSKA